MMSRLQRYCFSSVVVAAVAATAPSAGAQDPTGAERAPQAEPTDASAEAVLIQRIRDLTNRKSTHDNRPAEKAVQLVEMREALHLVDQLLARFPETSFRDDALIIKLRGLAEFARVSPEKLAQLMMLNEEIAKGKPSERLAAENDFFAIQAFVYGARAEEMPEALRIEGTTERYRAFLERHANSPRRPVIYASLVRALVQAGNLTDARNVLQAFRAEFPKHPALRRAAGEVALADAVGKPYAFSLVSGEQGRIDGASLRGKVVILHFWASWSKPSLELATPLHELYDAFGEKELAIISVSLDTDKKRLEAALMRMKMPWTKYADLQGFKSPSVVATGIVAVPTVMVIDRHGILRSVGDGSDVTEVVRHLIKSSKPD